MSEISFQTRPILATDAEAVAALIRAVFGAIDPPLAPPPSAVRETGESVAGKIEGGGGAVAEAGDVLVGAVLWEVRDGGLYIGRLSVDPAWRRRGVAQALVRLAEQAAQTAGQPRLHLGVRLALPGNRALFASLGFCETIQHAHDGFDVPTWVEMEKQLS